MNKNEKVLKRRIDIFKKRDNSRDPSPLVPALPRGNLIQKQGNCLTTRDWHRLSKRIKFF